jgi:hypothetical protein
VMDGHAHDGANGGVEDGVSRATRQNSHASKSIGHSCGKIPS